MKKCTIIKHHSKECCKIEFAKNAILFAYINFLLYLCSRISNYGIVCAYEYLQ